MIFSIFSKHAAKHAGYARIAGEIWAGLSTDPIDTTLAIGIVNMYIYIIYKI